MKFYKLAVQQPESKEFKIDENLTLTGEQIKENLIVIKTENPEIDKIRESLSELKQFNPAFKDTIFFVVERDCEVYACELGS